MLIWIQFELCLYFIALEMQFGRLNFVKILLKVYQFDPSAITTESEKNKIKNLIT